MRTRWSRLLVVLGLTCAWPAHAQTVTLEEAFPALTFNLAVDLQNAGDGSDRLFAVEQAGVIKGFANDPAVNTATVFLDIRSRVLSNDRFGLLGLAFHPDYTSNGYFFVHYTASGPQRSVIARYQVDPEDPDRADPNSEVVILEVAQPHRFHNGGQLLFGPDGYLYIPLGDGGPGRDPNAHGQNRTTLLGSVLRIDIDNPAGNLNYSMPADNPFVGNTNGFREEIWAWGFRNPWRASFDPATGRLWAAENGEDFYEEIDVVDRGKNYGWSVMEGRHCFNPSVGCNTSGLEVPVWEYGGNTQRRSVIGGYVYHGRRNPELAGRYIYTDFLRGQGWALAYDGTNPPTNTTIFTGQFGIATFGLDEQGELYLSNINDGKIYRFAPTSTRVEEEGIPTFYLAPNYPNPFNPSTTIAFTLRQSQVVSLAIYDVQGRVVKTLLTGRQPAGWSRVVWDGTNSQGMRVPSGVYLYQLASGSHTETRALLLLK